MVETAWAALVLKVKVLDYFQFMYVAHVQALIVPYCSISFGHENCML